MKQLLLFICTLIFNNGFGQIYCSKKDKTSLDLINAKGQIKKITENHYKHNYHRNEDDSTFYIPELEYYLTFSYNIYGNITEIKQFRIDGSIVSTEKYIYDTLQRVKERINFYSDSTSKGKCSCIYNNFGLAIQEVSSLYSDKYISSNTYMKYNQNNQITELSLLARLESYSFKYFYEYDSVGNNIKQISIMADTSVSYYKFDNYLNIIEEKSIYKPDGKITTYAYEYDNLHNEISVKTFEGIENELKNSVNRTYQFDHQNNWIKKTSKAKDNNYYFNSIEREIEYY